VLISELIQFVVSNVVQFIISGLTLSGILLQTASVRCHGLSAGSCQVSMFHGARLHSSPTSLSGKVETFGRALGGLSLGCLGYRCGMVRCCSFEESRA